MSFDLSFIYKYINDPSWWQAIGTVAAVILALGFYFIDKWKAFRERPILDVSINFHPPDCHSIPAWVRDGSGNQRFVPAYWFRLTISNVGKSSAQNVEVMIQDLKKKIDSSWTVVPEFLLSNLNWTHLSTQYIPMLLPGTHKNVDLAHIIDPAARAVVPSEQSMQFSVPEQETIIFFEITIHPNTRYNIVSNGEYQFTIIVGASNCPPIFRSFNITCSGKWFADESEMLSNGISISTI